MVDLKIPNTVKSIPKRGKMTPKINPKIFPIIKKILFDLTETELSLPWVEDEDLPQRYWGSV